jgi:hypothetical protein
MSEPSEPRPIDSTAVSRQSWIVPIIALAMFALFVWLFLGGRDDPPAGAREHPKKSEGTNPPRGGVRE